MEHKIEHDYVLVATSNIVKSEGLEKKTTTLLKI